MVAQTRAAPKQAAKATVRKDVRPKQTAPKIKLATDQAGKRSVQIVKAVATSVLGANVAEGTISDALVEIVEECLNRPEKTLLMARWVKDDALFEVKPAVTSEWIHYTLGKCHNIPKYLKEDIILEIASQYEWGKKWNADLLRKVHKHYKNNGVHYLFYLMTNTEAGDKIPDGCRFKPLCVKVFVKFGVEFLSKWPAITISKHGVIDMQKTGKYFFSQADGERWTHVKHRLTDIEIPLPSETNFVISQWSIMDDHSDMKAYLMGPRRKGDQLFELFQEVLEQTDEAFEPPCSSEELDNIAVYLSEGSIPEDPEKAAAVQKTTPDLKMQAKLLVSGLEDGQVPPSSQRLPLLRQEAEQLAVEIAEDEVEMERDGDDSVDADSAPPGDGTPGAV